MVVRSKRHHNGSSARRIGPYRCRHIVEGLFILGLIIHQDGLPVRLYQQFSGGKEPGEWEEVGREGVFEDGRVDGLASRWVELVRGVVLSWVVDESSGPATTDLDGEMSWNKFQLVERHTIIKLPSSRVSLRGRLVAVLECLTSTYTVGYHL